MYFEPTKKIYYRFPSSQSIDYMSTKNYFPDKPEYDKESASINLFNNHVIENNTTNE